MGELIKEAVLKLKVEGFAQAEASSAAMAKAFAAASHYGTSLEAVSRTLTGPLSTTAQALEIIQSDAGRAVAQFERMQAALAKVAAESRIAAGAAGEIGGGGGRILPGPGSGGGSGAGGGAVAAATTLADLTGPAVAVAGALYTAKAGAEALFEAIGRGEKSAVVADSFDKLTASIGGSAAVLGALQAATGGAVDNQTLMLSTNKLMIADLGLSQEQLAKLSASAVAMSRVMGTDAAQAVRDLGEGIQKQSPMILDNLGITVKSEEALKEYAKAHHISADEIDAHARKTIFLEELMRGLDAAQAKVGGSGEIVVSAAQMARTEWANFTTALDVFISKQPGFSEALKATADAAIAIGTALTPLIQLAGQVAHELAPLIQLMGQGAAYLAGSGGAATLVGGALSALPGGGLLGAPIAALGAAQGSASAFGFTGTKGAAAPSKIEVNITAGTPREVAEKTQRELERFNREQIAAPGFGG